MAKSSLILQIFVDIKPTSERKQSPSDGTRHGGDNCWPTAVGGEMLSIVNGNLWGGFIADLSYVNFVPLGDFLDINGDIINLGSTFGRSQIDLFSPQI